MIELLLALLSAVLAFFCDNIITDQQKASLVKFIRNSNFSAAAREAGIQAHDIYIEMIADGFTESKFWVRSILFFLGLTFLAILGKVLGDPTYLSVFFMPIELGTWPEKLSWCLCSALFLLLFIFMSMQAKFFLKILSRSVGALQGAVTIYSLAISTVFTAILGTAAIATLNTAIISSSERVSIGVDLDFSRPLRALESDEDSGKYFIVKPGEPKTAVMSISVKHRVGDQQSSMIDRAFDLSKIDAESVKNLDYSKSEEVIRVRNSRNVPLTYYDRKKEFSSNAENYVKRPDFVGISQGDKIEYRLLRDKICSKIYDKKSDVAAQVFFEIKSKEQDIVNACKNRKAVHVEALVRINSRNISWPSVFAHNFAAVTLGFFRPFGGTVLGIYKYNPYAYFGQSTSWRDVWVIDDNFSTLPMMLSGILGNSYDQERDGRGNPNYNRGIILSPYLFSSFAISFFTLWTFVVALLVAPVFFSCSMLRLLEGRLKIDQYPATLLIFSVFGIYAAVFAILRFIFW